MGALTALHEAGHAVCALGVGATVERARADAEREGAGWMDYVGDVRGFDALVIRVGGCVADSLDWFPEIDHPLPRFPWFYDNVPGSDAYEAMQLLRTLGVDTADRAVDRAEQILRARWSGVRAVETALRARGELSGGEIRRLIAALPEAGRPVWR